MISRAGAALQDTWSLGDIDVAWRGLLTDKPQQNPL